MKKWLKLLVLPYVVVSSTGNVNKTCAQWNLTDPAHAVCVTMKDEPAPDLDSLTMIASKDASANIVWRCNPVKALKAGDPVVTCDWLKDLAGALNDQAAKRGVK